MSPHKQCDLTWVATKGKNIPEGAVKGGHNQNKEDIFICRVKIDALRLIGKINKEHGVCYVPLEGKENPVTEFDTLVVNTLNAKTTEPAVVKTTTPTTLLVTNPVHKYYTGAITTPSTTGRDTQLFSGDCSYIASAK